MEKTEMMKRYEETTYLDDDPQSLIQIIEYLKDCVQGYKAKAEELVKEMAKPTITYQAVETFQEIIRNQCDEISALKEKANAYDRLMSGNPTPKEIANLLGMVIAQNPNNTWAAFNSMPNLSFFTRRWETADKKKGLDITHCHIRYNDAWGNSLTLPDGWEEA